MLWFVLCATDGIDGYLARRHGTTRSGAFLDPLADKVLVLGAMFSLVGNGVFWWCRSLIIAAREVVISVYRSVRRRQRGVSVPASQLAKYKTLCQQLAVGFALLPLTAARRARGCGTRCCGSAVVLAVVSGCQYLSAAASAHRPTGRDVGARCGVTSSPSAPSCCSARSSTPTRRGSASSCAAIGIDSHFQVKVGDNLGRIVAVLRQRARPTPTR